MGEGQTPAVFVTARGTPLRTPNLRRLFVLHRDRAGLPDTITVHSLRHTCATEMLKGGASKGWIIAVDPGDHQDSEWR